MLKIRRHLTVVALVLLSACSSSSDKKEAGDADLPIAGSGGTGTSADAGGTEVRKRVLTAALRARPGDSPMPVQAAVADEMRPGTTPARRR